MDPRPKNVMNISTSSEQTSQHSSSTKVGRKKFNPFKAFWRLFGDGQKSGSKSSSLYSGHNEATSDDENGHSRVQDGEMTLGLNRVTSKSLNNLFSSDNDSNKTDSLLHARNSVDEVDTNLGKVDSKYDLTSSAKGKHKKKDKKVAKKKKKEKKAGKVKRKGDHNLDMVEAKVEANLNNSAAHAKIAVRPQNRRAATRPSRLLENSKSIAFDSAGIPFPSSDKVETAEKPQTLAKPFTQEHTDREVKTQAETKTQKESKKTPRVPLMPLKPQMPTVAESSSVIKICKNEEESIVLSKDDVTDAKNREVKTQAETKTQEESKKTPRVPLMPLKPQMPTVAKSSSVIKICKNEEESIVLSRDDVINAESRPTEKNAETNVGESEPASTANNHTKDKIKQQEKDISEGEKIGILKCDISSMKEVATLSETSKKEHLSAQMSSNYVLSEDSKMSPSTRNNKASFKEEMSVVQYNDISEDKERMDSKTKDSEIDVKIGMTSSGENIANSSKSVLMPEKHAKPVQIIDEVMDTDQQDLLTKVDVLKTKIVSSTSQQKDDINTSEHREINTNKTDDNLESLASSLHESTKTGFVISKTIQSKNSTNDNEHYVDGNVNKLEEVESEKKNYSNETSLPKLRKVSQMRSATEKEGNAVDAGNLVGNTNFELNSKENKFLKLQEVTSSNSENIKISPKSVVKSVDSIDSSSMIKTVKRVTPNLQEESESEKNPEKMLSSKSTAIVPKSIENVTPDKNITKQDKVKKEQKLQNFESSANSVMGKNSQTTETPSIFPVKLRRTKQSDKLYNTKEQTKSTSDENRVQPVVEQSKESQTTSEDSKVASNQSNNNSHLCGGTRTDIPTI